MEYLKEAGIDVEEALERFSGNENLYIKILKRFSEDKNFELLKKAVSEKNNEAAAAYAHSLKGISGNLSIKGVYRVSSELEEALRKGHTENLNPLLKKLQLEYEKTSKAIAKLP